MKIVKDKKEVFKNLKKKYQKNELEDLKFLLNLIVKFYELKDPEIIDIKEDDDLEISIKDKNIPIRTYKIIINMDINDKVFVELSDKNYVDSFKYYKKYCIINDKRIYENPENNIVIQKFIYNNNYLSLNKYMENNKEPYLYSFKNNYLFANIIISIPLESPFVENFFVKNLLEHYLEITNIEILFYVIKDILNCSKAHIKVSGEKNKDNEEVIDYDSGILLEYKRITDEKMIEYKDGYKELLITKYEKETLDNEEFQKVLKMITY